MPADISTLEHYYGQLPVEGGLDARCDMQLASSPRSRRVIDLGCRRGKGVYKLAELVGPKGLAVGVDWRAGFVEAAKAGVEHTAQKGGIAPDAMQFVLSYPETLAQSGLEPGSFDVVYVNAVLNLLFDPKLALKNMSYLLKPGGILVYNGVLATRPRDEGVREQARRIGNAVQSAPERKQFVSWLAQAGFNMVSFVNNNEQRIEPSAGANEGAAVPVVETDEPVSFVSGVFEVCKDDHVDYHTQDLKQDISQFR